MNISKTKLKSTKVKKKQIPKVLKPHGTATWLLLNYPDLTIEQIGAFCEMDSLKVLFLKNEIDNGKEYPSHNPVYMGYISEEDLEEAEKNPKKKLNFIGDNIIENIQKKRNKRTYISFLEKKNRLSGALWLVNFYKNLNLSIEHIKKLSKASSSNINKLMTNKKFTNGITPTDPTKLNLCTRDELEEILILYENKK
jgi:hypothetical protein